MKLNNKTGFSLVEALLASALFALLVTALTGAWIYGQEAGSISGQRARARLIAEECLEAVRNIRDNDYANLSAGTFGLSTTTNQWNTTSTSDIINGFTRQVTITTLDSKRKSVSCTVTWPETAQRTGSITLTTELTNWMATVSSGKGGMLVYGDGGTTLDAIKYKLLDPATNTWGTASSTADIDAGTTNRALRAASLYASATRNEKVLLSRHYNGTAQYIYAQVYNGTTTSWGSVQLLSNWNAATFLDVKNFDGTYLVNGNFMVVYSDNTNVPKTRTWNGSAWSGASSLTSLGAAGQIPNYIVAKARSGTNEVMAAFFTQASDAITEYYSGVAWSAITSHSNAAPVNTKRLIDFAWSPNNSLIGGLVYSNNGNDRSLNIKIWTANGSGSGAWSGTSNSNNQGLGSTRLGAVAIIGRPGANTFLACNANTVPQVICYQSNFTPTWSNPTNQIIAPLTDTGIQRSFDIGYELASSTYAIGVYSDQSTIPKLKKYNPAITTFDAAATALSAVGAALKTVKIIPKTATNDMMILMADNNLDVFTVAWNGTTHAAYTTPAGYAFTGHGTSGSNAADYWYDFVWDGF